MELIQAIREKVPGIHIRTTLLVGFPGETEEDFQELMEFVKWAKFERMGAFAYSEEEGTYSAKHYEDDVPEEVKQSRLDQLMALQQDISAEVEAERWARCSRSSSIARKATIISVERNSALLRWILRC